jgi:hypothetical protein
MNPVAEEPSPEDGDPSPEETSDRLTELGEQFDAPSPEAAPEPSADRPEPGSAGA